MTSKQRDELLADLFGDAIGEASLRCSGWMLSEPRFAAFVDQYRDKIRKKARYAEGAEGIGDLFAELAVAHDLLGEPRFTLAYEAYAADKARGPDFTVTYKGHTPFNVEVKRLRPGSPTAFESRVTDAVCEKLRQMPAAAMNVLVVVAYQPLSASDLTVLLRQMVVRAEQDDATFFARHGFTGTRDFFAGFRRLSALMVRAPSGVAASTRGTLWRNAQARHPLHPDLPNLLTR